LEKEAEHGQHEIHQGEKEGQADQALVPRKGKKILQVEDEDAGSKIRAGRRQN